MRQLMTHVDENNKKYEEELVSEDESNNGMVEISKLLKAKYRKDVETK